MKHPYYAFIKFNEDNAMWNEHEQDMEREAYRMYKELDPDYEWLSNNTYVLRLLNRILA